MKNRGRLAPVVLLLAAAVAGAWSARLDAGQKPETAQSASRLSVTRFVALGDSLTAGFLEVPPAGLRATRDYPSKLMELLSSRYRDQRFNVVNAGRGGEKAADALSRLPALLKAEKPQVVLLMEGTNDLVDNEPGIDRSLQTIQRMVQMDTAAGVRTIVATIPPQRAGAPRSWAGHMVPVFNGKLEPLAKQKGWRLADVNGAFDRLSVLLGPDGLHPTSAGYDRIAQVFFDAIRATFETAPGAAAGRK
jgi:lysophospholipase L1-like esterase